MSIYKSSPAHLRRKFEVAIICALHIESTAVVANFDEVFDSALYGKALGDTNSYTLGRMGSHHVVLAYLPSTGKASSAGAAACLRVSFSNIRLGLLVGVCGGLPSFKEHGELIEMILGDIVVGTGIVQYDFGRQYDHGRVIRKQFVGDSLGRPPEEIRSFLHKCQASLERPTLQEKVQQYITTTYDKPEFADWKRPTTEHDILYESDYEHRHRTIHTCTVCSASSDQICAQAREATCSELACSKDHTILRSRHNLVTNGLSVGPECRIHWGRIASGDSVIRSGKIRDAIAREENVIAFEMEGAGGWEAFPMIVVKGVCDYADSHKNKRWQKFAALAAAAGAKVLLSKWAVISPGSEGNEEHRDNSHWENPGSSDILSASSSLQNPIQAKPAVWLVPFERGEQLVGRSNELEQIETVLFQQEYCARAAIEGLGGIGKTRLALELVYLTKKKFTDTSIFWIQCSNVSTFERDCRKVLQCLEVPAAEDFSLDPKTLMQQQLNDDNTGKWLLILDNADDEELWSANAAATSADALINFIPRGCQGSVLVTTRNHRIAFDVAQKKCVKLGQLRSSDSRLVLQNLLQQPEILTNVQNTNQLLEHLTHLPLAIVQAAAFINQNNLDDIDQYLQIWNDENESEIIQILNEEFTANDRYRDSQNPIAKTWLISFKQIKLRDPLAVDLLSLMACLDAKHMTKSCLPGSLRSRLELKAFGTLRNYAFIQTQQCESSDTVFDMHRLVHLATRNYLRHHQEFSVHLQRVAKHLSGLIPHSGLDATGFWRRYVPHAEKVASTPDIGDNLTRAQLQEILANVHLATGMFSKSLMLRQAVIDWLTEHPRSNTTQLIRNVSRLSDTLRQVGRFQEGLTAAQRAFNLLGKLSDNDPTKISTMASLADAFSAVGRFEEAVRLGNEALVAAKAFSNQNQAAKVNDVVSALHILSGVYHSLRRYHDEERILLDAIEVVKGHTDSGRWILKTELEIMLSAVHCRLGKGQSAERRLIQLRQMLQTRLGRLHHFTLKSVACLAEAYSCQGRLSDAKLLYEELLCMYDEAGRGNDTHVLCDRGQLAYVLINQGQYTEAKNLQLGSIGRSVLLSGKDSGMTLDMLEILSWCYYHLGKRKLAVSILTSCVKRSRVHLDPQHPDMLDRIRLLRQWSKSSKANAKRHRVS